MKSAPNNDNGFRPPWYLRSGHVQTLLTGFYKPKAQIDGEVEHLVPIGVHGSLCVYENVPAKEFQPHNAIFLLHGLGSSHRGTYMTRVTEMLLRKGHRVFRFDLPGAGDSYIHTQLPPHGACSNLIWQALIYLSKHCGVTNWRGAGISLGGNILLKILANHAEDLAANRVEFQVDKAVAVAPPIDLGACCDNMERFFNRIYARYFLRSLKAQTKVRAAIWPEWKIKLAGASFRTIRDFDETVTSGLAGFQNASHYYESGSSIHELELIQTPTTVLVDEHDPIVPYELFANARLSSSMSIVTTRKGGHVGYLSRDDEAQPKLQRWADHWVANEVVG